MAETCCAPTLPAPVCPLTGRPTLPVSRSTVLAHAALADLPETALGFCDMPTCDVVYVGADGLLIEKAQLATRVGIKETEDPVPVCYCWNVSRRQIVDDHRQHGRSTIRAAIEERLRQGLCRCESANPSGRCCLGEVGRAIAVAREG
ncbi:MAG: hypothetical protein IT306_10150 [Chloroflexi bacterium]|nr:hypothetical protein [Chloroflexota bacterium]